MRRTKLVLRYVIGGAFAGALGLHLVGLLLPRVHQASIEVEVPAEPGEVFNLITDVGNAPRWRPDVERVEIVSESPLTFREISEGDAILFEELQRRDRNRWVTRIADPDLPFGGTWTFELVAAGPRTHVRITEKGFVNSPVFRVLSKYAFGHDTSLRRYASHLRRHFAAAAG